MLDCGYGGKLVPDLCKIEELIALANEEPVIPVIEEKELICGEVKGKFLN